MRITSLSRRLVAVLASAALFTTGGAAAGPLLTLAFAAPSDMQTVTPNSVVKSGGGAAINNQASSTFTVSGTNFYGGTVPGGGSQETVSLVPTFAGSGQPPIGTSGISVAGCPTPPANSVPDALCSGPITFTADLRMAAPGVYDVQVVRTPISTTTGSSDTDYCYSCLQIFSAGPATVTSSAKNGTLDNGGLIITGSNFANGLTVVFYNTDSTGAATTPDPTLHFTGTVGTNGTTITGTYTADSGAGGRKVVRAFNIDDTQAPGPGGAFVQPRINSIAPTALGQGANTIPVVVTGAGFDAGTTAVWSDTNVTVAGPLVPSSGGTTVTVPTTVASNTGTGSKNLTLRGTGGAYTTAVGVLTVNPAPIPTAGVGERGQGGTTSVSIPGTGFTTGTLFDFGAGVTATTLGTTTPTSAQVSITVDPNATPGTRPVISTNPDKGTSTVQSAISVVAKPLISTVTPASGGINKSVPVTLTGTGFATSGGVTLTVSGTGVTVGATTVNSSSSVSSTFNIGSGAVPGPRDVTIVNNSNGGRSTCASCFGINSLSIDQPAGAANNGPKTLVFSGAGVDSTTVVTLSIPGSQTYQAPLVGTTVACPTPAAGTVCATFDLENRVGHGVATGRYSATATTGSSVLTCTACFPVVQPSPPTVTGLAPASGGQGAIDRSITITGTNFSPGETVVFSGAGITTSSVTWNSPTQITAVYSIAGNAPTGTRGLQVTNIGDGSTGSSADNAFTVNAGPTIASTDRATLGQNAAWDVTLTGTNYAAGAVADFGPGTTSVTKTVAATSLVVTVTVSDTADTAPIRDIRVTNADGGSAVLAGAFRVTPAPRITSITPGFAKPGETKTVTIAGSGFTTNPPPASGATAPTTCPTPANGSCPTITVAGLLATVKTVSVDGTTMTADFAVNANAPIGTPAVKVINPDHGQSTKLAGFRIATVPVAPTNVAVPVAGNSTATVTWAFPTTTNADGGSPLTSFIVDDGDPTTNNAQTVAPDVRSANFTGLTNGHTYTFTVKATNQVGQSAAGTAQGTPNSPETTLTSTRSPLRSIAGSVVTFSGKLIRTSSGAGIAGQTIHLSFTPDIGTVRRATVTTNAQGVWVYQFAPIYNETVRSGFVGTSTLRTSNGPTYTMGVAPKIVRTAPVNGATSSHTTPLQVTGSIAPNKAGRTIFLRKGDVKIANAVVASNGTFVLKSNLPPGTFTLNILMPVSPGNIAGVSASFTVKRT